MARISVTANMTATELAAWKANNRKQSAAGTVVITATKPACKTQRQEAQELLIETEDMIRAAKRQGHWQLIPALLQRHNTFTAIVSNRAFA